jgi:hypothetical protein
MKHLLVAALAGLAGLSPLAAGSAQAQLTYPIRPPNYGVGYRPGLSPYLNINRGGDPAINYYLGTIPEFQRRANAAQFRSQILDLETRASAPAPEEADILTPLPSTGHVTAFNNTAGFFNNPNPRTPGMAAGTAAPTRSGVTGAPPPRGGRGGRP